MASHPTSPSVPTRSAVPGPLGPIQREFDRLFDRFAGWNIGSDLALSPRMDVTETKDGLELSIELPGLTQAEVKVAVEDEVLTVSGEKKAEKTVEEKDYRLSERSYGAFSRSIILPRSVDADKITAVMKDGVLKISAPKDGQATTRTVAIQASH